MGGPAQRPAGPPVRIQKLSRSAFRRVRAESSMASRSRRAIDHLPTGTLPARSLRTLVRSRMTAASPALLGLAEADGAVRCVACAHRCLVRPGRAGICRVRENRDGRLVTTVFGQAVAANRRPIEKKPLFHVYPGSIAFSIATRGCNFHCLHCQNWTISPGRARWPERRRVRPASRRGRGRRPGRRFAQRRLYLHRADCLHRVRRRDCATGHGGRPRQRPGHERLSNPGGPGPACAAGPGRQRRSQVVRRVASIGASSARAWLPSWTHSSGCGGAASGSR